DIFRWRAPGGEEVVVIYQRSYGETCFPDGLEYGLSFAHTNDNIGPQSVPQTAEAYRQSAPEGETPRVETIRRETVVETLQREEPRRLH
ncbi:hypothetical protein ACC760_38450, partial [Rhizobium ruizarguesonis]